MIVDLKGAMPMSGGSVTNLVLTELSPLGYHLHSANGRLCRDEHLSDGVLFFPPVFMCRVHVRAALRADLGRLEKAGLLIVNTDTFEERDLTKAGYSSNPLTDGSLKQWNVFNVPISTLNSRALEGLGLRMQEGRGP